MVREELKRLVQKVKDGSYNRCAVLLVKASRYNRFPLYPALSGFANKNGGIILFGIDEKKGPLVTGVQNPDRLCAYVSALARQMEPQPEIVFTVAVFEGKSVVAAEIAECKATLKPCFYKGTGRLRGSYIRCDGDFLPLSPVELYQYEAYKGSIHDDIRPLSQVPAACLDKEATARFLARLKSAKPRLSQLPDREILALQGLFDGQEQLPTISAVLLLADYPQRFFPQLRIIASMEDCALQQIDGTIPQMLESALAFVRRCTQPTEEYPADAVRQLVLNALMHRDYSLYTEHLPVRLTLYRDRLEIKSPGGLYGPQSLDRLGKSQGIARNCYLALALESLGLAENRFCGIPLVRRLMDSAGLAPPVFADRGGEFTALLYRRTWAVAAAPTPALEADMHKLLAFCVQPRSREEIRLFLGLNTGFYAIAHYVRPLLERGLLRMTLPDRPRSKKQRYITVQI